MKNLINMNKFIKLISIIMIVFINSNKGCLMCLKILKIMNIGENDTGIEAFKKAYYNLTSRMVQVPGKYLLNIYFHELYNLAIDGFQAEKLSSPRDWCIEIKGKDSKQCEYNLINTGYKRIVSGIVKEMNSFEAFKYSFKQLNFKFVQFRNQHSAPYFEYLYNKYEDILKLKPFRSPKEFCNNINSTGPPPINLGEDQNKYAGSVSNRQVYVPLDDEGQFIDLNLPYNDENMNENNDEDLSQVKYADE